MRLAIPLPLLLASAVSAQEPTPPPVRDGARDTAVALTREAGRALATARPVVSRVEYAFSRLERLADALGVTLTPPEPDSTPPEATFARLARDGERHEAREAGVRADSASRRRDIWRRVALREIGETLAPLEALAFADSLGGLPEAVSSILSWRDLTDGVDEILAWVEETIDDPVRRQETHVEVLRLLAYCAPDQAWSRVSGLEPVDRARVGIAILHGSRVPAGIAGSVAREVESDLRTLDVGETSLGLQAGLRQGCSRKRLTFCTLEAPAGIRWVDFLNDMGRGDWDVALERRREWMEWIAPDSLRALEAYGLSRSHCRWMSCDLAPFDSLFNAWIPGIEDASARAEPGEARDLLLLRIATLWAARDPRRAGSFAALIDSPKHRVNAVNELVRSAWEVAPLTAVAVHRELMTTYPATARTHLLLVQMGRLDEANRVLDAMEGNARLVTRLEWAARLLDAGRWSEAHDIVAEALTEWQPSTVLFRIPAKVGVLIRQAGLVEPYLARVRASPDPLSRAIALTALIPAFHDPFAPVPTRFDD